MSAEVVEKTIFTIFYDWPSGWGKTIFYDCHPGEMVLNWAYWANKTNWANSTAGGQALRMRQGAG